jgi:RNA polymerase sigma-70 factor, ECF subfamily
MRRERKDHTLQPTALVSEAFVGLIELGAVEWTDRVHFFAPSARMMRRILVNHDGPAG